MPSTIVIKNSYLPLQAPLAGGPRFEKQETITIIERPDSSSSSPAESVPQTPHAEVTMTPVAVESLPSVVPSTMVEKNVSMVDTHTATMGAQDSPAGPIQTKLSPPRLRGAAKLKNMLDNSNDLIVCPGVYDGVSARVALQVGFDGLYMVCTRA
jgi:hypothetical protein